ncbi:MAG: hypothetical protein ACR2L1_04210 [Pyrinomonadaceae bacterium]
MRIYYLRSCPNDDDIKENHIVWFKTKGEAEAAGFRMAKIVNKIVKLLLPIILVLAFSFAARIWFYNLPK